MVSTVKLLWAVRIWARKTLSFVVSLLVVLKLFGVVKMYVWLAKFTSKRLPGSLVS